MKRFGLVLISMLLLAGCASTSRKGGGRQPSSSGPQWQPGDFIDFAQCSSDETLTIEALKGALARENNTNYDTRMLMTCSNGTYAESKMYVLNQIHDRDAKVKSFQVVRQIQPYSVESYFIETDPERSQFQKSIIDDSEGSTLFYLESSTVTCPQSAELKTIRFNSSERKFKSPFGTGLCYKGSQYQGIKIQGLNIIDYVQKQDGFLKFVADMPDALVIFAKVPGDLHTKEIGRLSGKELFPEGCGEYFEAARLYINSPKIALAFKSSKLLLVNYTQKPTATRTNYTVLNPGHTGDTTCEGSITGYGHLRNSFFIHELYQVDGSLSATMFFLATDKEYNPNFLKFPAN